METILSQYLPSKWTNSSQKDSFLRMKALLYEGNLAIRVVKVALLIFPLYALIRDGTDLLLGHRRVTPVKSPITNALKSSSQKVVTLSALSTLGISAVIYFLASKGAPLSVIPAVTQGATSGVSFLSSLILAGGGLALLGGRNCNFRRELFNRAEEVRQIRSAPEDPQSPRPALDIGLPQNDCSVVNYLSVGKQDIREKNHAKSNLSASSSSLESVRRQNDGPIRLNSEELSNRFEDFVRMVSLRLNGQQTSLIACQDDFFLFDQILRRSNFTRLMTLFNDFLTNPNPNVLGYTLDLQPPLEFPLASQVSLLTSPSSSSLIPLSNARFFDFSASINIKDLEELSPELTHLITQGEITPQYEGTKYEWKAKHSISLSHLRSKEQELGLREKMPNIRDALMSRGDPDKIYRTTANPNIFLQAYYCALKALFDENPSVTPYEQASKYLKYLRCAFSGNHDELNDYERDCLADLRQLSYHRFTGYAMSDYLQHIVHDKMPDAFPADDEFRFENMVTLLQEKNKQIKHKEKEVPMFVWLKIQLEKLKGSGLGGFDPNSKENVPYLRSRYTIQSEDDVRQVTHLRHGTPTMEPGIVTGLIRGGRKGYAEIIPEYEAFLTQVRDKDERVGYFNHQKMGGSEAHRVQAIQDLQKRFPKNFFFWSLPMDGAVFNCDDQYETMSDDDYKDLIVKLFQEGKKFAIPESFKADLNYPVRLKALLDEVHDLYFEKRDLRADPRNRRLMLLYFYAHLVDSMSAKLGLNFIVTCCKDNKDRGGAMTAICEVLRMFKLGIHTDRDNLRNLFIHVLGVGVHTKLEEILEHRLEFLTDALEHLSSLDVDQIERIQEHNRQAKVGQIIGFEYVQDTNPFALVTSREAFDKLLQKTQDDKTIFKQRHPAKDVFNDIKNAYRYRIVNEGRLKERTDEINAQELYDQAKRDVEKGSDVIVNKNPCRTLLDLTSALGLPESADAVDLTDQRQQKALVLMALTTQTGGGLAGKWMHEMQGISKRILEIKFTQLPGGKELLVAQATFDPMNGIYEVTYKTPYCFKSLIHNPHAERQVDRNSERLLATIPFEAHYDVTNKTVETRWWVENV